MWRRAFGLALLLAALTGCTAAVPGRGTAAAPALCPAAGADAGTLVPCVVAALNRFWTGRVGKPIEVRVTVDPAPTSVHRSCRSFLAFGTAFYCPADGRVYITAASVAGNRKAFGDRLPYALAAVVAHEAGHRVQFTVRQPELDRDGDAASRVVEQQADCLAGVWAHGAARRGLVDPAGFAAAYAQEMRLVSSLTPPPGAGLDDYDEVATHGTAAERIAAYERGDSEATNPCRLRST
ncbi:MAG TPA: neutral zinc metallopeptidase [Mycobacteriales bacterium]|nr:neutral zinc metallopeptidase [Mycobacteriales bacterium]